MAAGPVGIKIKGKDFTSRSRRAWKLAVIVCCLIKFYVKSQSHRPSKISQAQVCYPHSRFPAYKGLLKLRTPHIWTFTLQSFTNQRSCYHLPHCPLCPSLTTQFFVPKRHVSIAFVLVMSFQPSWYRIPFVLTLTGVNRNLGHTVRPLNSSK